MLNYFFGFSFYVTEGTVDARLFLQPQLGSHKNTVDAEFAAERTQ